MTDFFDVDDLNKLLNVSVVEGYFPERRWRQSRLWWEKAREAGARHSFRGGDEEFSSLFQVIYDMFIYKIYNLTKILDNHKNSCYIINIIIYN